jgi:hypothetical protein
MYIRQTVSEIAGQHLTVIGRESSQSSTFHPPLVPLRSDCPSKHTFVDPRAGDADAYDKQRENTGQYKI